MTRRDEKEVDRAWKDYSHRFRTKVMPKLMSTSVFLSIQGPNNGSFDVQQATEIGAALLFDKPILLVVPKGRTLPASLRRAADEVIDDWDALDPVCQERLSAALRRLAP